MSSSDKYKHWDTDNLSMVPWLRSIKRRIITEVEDSEQLIESGTVLQKSGKLVVATTQHMTDIKNGTIQDGSMSSPSTVRQASAKMFETIAELKLTAVGSEPPILSPRITDVSELAIEAKGIPEADTPLLHEPRTHPQSR